MFRNRLLASAILIAILAASGCRQTHVGVNDGADALTDGSNGQQVGPGGNGPGVIRSDLAADSTLDGPTAVDEGEYHLPMSTDATVANVPTELWAQVYRPKTLSGGPYPLLVFLHGNHGTCGVPATVAGQPRNDASCEYTTSGSCPAGTVVTPNHLGYAYLGRNLASWGYLVVSINANLGITCAQGDATDSGMILARGRLILRHLQQLQVWNKNGATPASVGAELKGKIDFTQVGMMGHSRGGEGVRAALAQYRDTTSPWPTAIGTPVDFRGIFEIAPVDGQSSRVMNGDGVPWSVILPMCDGDVSNLQGARPFDRQLVALASGSPTTAASFQQRSTVGVWGANHNFYNTEWQNNDSDAAGGCQGHNPLWTPGAIESASQRSTALATLSAFFRANVGAKTDRTFSYDLDPAFRLPRSVTAVARVTREVIDSPATGRMVFLGNFDSVATTETATSASFSRLNINNPHDPSRQLGRVSWEPGAAGKGILDITWAAQDLSKLWSFDFSVSRSASALNAAATPTDFSVQLLDANNTLSTPVSVATYLNLLGPVGTPGNLHPLLMTVRVPFADIHGVNLSRIKGVRFSFDKTTGGEVYLSALRASSADLPTLKTAAFAPGAFDAVFSGRPAGFLAQPQPVLKGQLRRIRSAGTPLGVPGSQFGALSPTQPVAPVSVLEFFTDKGFPIRDALPLLMLEGAEPAVGHYAVDGDTRRMFFQLPGEAVDQAADGAPLLLQYGDRGGQLVDLGGLDKSLQDP